MLYNIYTLSSFLYISYRLFFQNVKRVPQKINTMQTLTLTKDIGRLSLAQRFFYEKNGFLVIPRLISLDILNKCSKRYIRYTINQYFYFKNLSYNNITGLTTMLPEKFQRAKRPLWGMWWIKNLSIKFKIYCTTTFLWNIFKTRHFWIS